MAKRYSDSDRYSKPFFKGLPGAYKLLWEYMCADCDNAGIWIKDFEVAQILVGRDMPISEVKALQFFKDRIIVLDGGSKWFLKTFIEFQYECTIEDLNPKNNAHLSVIKKLKKEGLIGAPHGGAKDKDKDQDKDLDKDKYITVDDEKIFDPMPILEFYEAALNGRQKENSARNWRDVVPEWFEQNLQMDFSNQKHVLNAFSKYLLNSGRPPNVKHINGSSKLTPEELKEL